jgi:glycosyltransferase involved in cell wall biosynthesis
VICAYTEKRWDELCAAVKSSLTQSIPAREVILVIDHNESLRARARAQFSNIVLLENKETQGLAGARNTGVESAQGDVIAFLDDDAVASSNWLGLLSEGYKDSDIIGVGGKLEPLWPNGRPAWFPEEFDWVVGCTYRGLPEERASIRNLIGANMSFRREVFEEVRFYSGIGHTATNPLGGSDPDFCIRVTQRFPNKLLLYEPQALVFHNIDEKRTRRSYFHLRCFNEGLSKSVLTRRVGTQAGLSSERRYVVHTLPKAVLKGFVDVLHGDMTGHGRSITIIVGLMITTTGYLIGLLRQRVALQKLQGHQPAIKERLL